jgi:hypothetical protein
MRLRGVQIIITGLMLVIFCAKVNSFKRVIKNLFLPAASHVVRARKLGRLDDVLLSIHEADDRQLSGRAWHGHKVDDDATAAVAQTSRNI